MNVVMTSAGFWPAVGGAERQALEQAAALAARGHRVTVLTRRLGSLSVRAQVRGVDVRRLPVLGRGALDSLCFVAGVFAWLMTHRGEWDAVHAHLAGSPALAAAAAARLLGRPVVVKLGGGPGIGELAASSRTAAGRLKLRALAALSPRFVAVARGLADEARRYLGRVPVELLSNGVDVSRFTPASPERRRALRADLGWPEDAVVFLYAGRLSPEKRLGWFLNIFLSASEGGGAVAALAGDGPEREELAAIAKGSKGRVRLLLPRDDVETLYPAADVFFLPSISEGLSNALLEAMACGLCPLASAVGGTPELVDDGRDGLLFARDDAAAAARLVRGLIAEPALAARLGAAARAEVEERYGLDRVVSRLEALYRGEA